MEQLVGTNIDGGVTCRAWGSLSSGLPFREVMECGVLTRREYLGGGGSPTESSSLGETDRDEMGEVESALALSSCSSSASRLGEMIRERFILNSHRGRLLESSIGSMVKDVIIHPAR